MYAMAKNKNKNTYKKRNHKNFYKINKNQITKNFLGTIFREAIFTRAFVKGTFFLEPYMYSVSSL